VLSGKKDPLGYALKAELTAADRELLLAFASGPPIAQHEEGVEE
jgi:hypothetical protein